MLNREKRGQVTVFIFLGIILLIALVAVLYVERDFIREKLGVIVEEEIVVPPQAERIKTYVDSCIRDLAVEGIVIMGMQGGYIDMPEDPIPVTPANPFSNGLYIFPGEELKVPYWYYETANGLQKEQVPSLKEMEKELEKYVNNNLAECVGDFSVFKREGYEITNKTFSTNVKIADSSVSVTVKFPIQIRLKDFEFKINKFHEKIDVNLGKLYKMGIKILDSENRDYFLEERTIDMMVVYDEIPYSGTEFKCEKKIWFKSKVAEDFKKILETNIAFVRVKGTEYSLAEKDHSYFVWKALDKNYEDVHASLFYSKSWPLKLEIYPSNGEILKGDTIISEASEVTRFLTSLFCLNNYHFVYDVKYPVLIVLSDDKGLNGDGYIFQFAMQVIVDNNQPRENRLGTLNVPSSEAEICKNALTEITVNALKVERNEDLTPVKDAKVSFKCITTVCDMGSTGRDGSLTTKFPQCINGLVTATKEGLHEGKEFISTNEEVSISVMLEPYYNLDFDVKLIGKDTGIIRGLTKSEQVVMQFENSEEDYSTSLVYPAEENKVKLIAGNYKVKSYVIDKSSFGVRIEDKVIEECVDVPMGVLGLFGLKEKKCFKETIPGTTLDQVVKGGAEFEWVVNRGELAGSNKILFYTIVDKTPRSYDDLTTVYENIEDNARSSVFIYPRFGR